MSKKSGVQNIFDGTLQKWLTYCRADGLAERTVWNYEVIISKFWWWWCDTGYNTTVGTHPKLVTTEHAREFVAYLRSEQKKTRWGKPVVRQRYKLANATVTTFAKNVKVWFSWLELQGIVPRNPFDKSVKLTSKKKDAVIKSVPEEDLTRLLQYLSNPERLKTYAGLRNYTLVVLLLDSGIRKGELLSIRLKDLDLKYGRVVIRGKSGQRVAVFGQSCADVLRTYLKHEFVKGLKPDDFIFRSINDIPLCSSTFNTIIIQISQKSGVRFHAHRLRHTFATMMAKQVNIFDLKTLLGHSDIATTSIYVKSSVLEQASTPTPLGIIQAQEQAKKRRGRPPSNKQVNHT